MGFASPLLLALLLGLSTVDGFWFGGMQEPDVMGRGLERRQTMECNSGSTDCGLAGCISTAACCNAAADWSCLEGNACYTVDGTVDCYTTTLPVPTVSRACYDYTQSGCRGGLTCFQCRSSSYGRCVTTVLFSGSETWLNCFTSSTIKTINVPPASTSASSPSADVTTGPTTSRPSGSGRNPTGTSSSSFIPTESPSPDPGLGGGAIAGIVIGSFAVLTIAAVSLFLLFRKKTPVQAAQVSQPPPPAPSQPIYPGYQQPPYQNDPMYPQPPYSPQPQQYYGGQPMQQATGYPGSPGSPVPDQTKEQPQAPTSFPAELSSHQH